MRIAQIAPLYESVPPQCYGGTERVVSYLTEELVRLGHEVTLFASGDSRTRARLVPCCPRSLRLDERSVDPLAHHVRALELVMQHAHEFDVLHFHTDYLHLPLSRRLGYAHVTTLHGRLDIPDLAPLYAEFDDAPLVSISDAQRAPLPAARWIATVHHGLPVDLHEPVYAPGSYLAFLGRVSPDKGVERAIAIACAAGLPLKIAAKVDRADRRYYHERIEPLLDGARIEFLGEVGERDKGRLLGGALAVLFPIDWPEPFGLVMIESLACGTPVIAHARGSVTEVIEDGLTGWIVDGLDEAVRAVHRAGELSRAACRAEFERRFTSERMARDYVEVYAGVIARTSGLAAGA